MVVFVDLGVVADDDVEVGIKIEVEGEEVTGGVQAEIEIIIPNIITNARNLFAFIFTSGLS
jgi:hypothetical protein